MWLSRSPRNRRRKRARANAPSGHRRALVRVATSVGIALVTLALLRFEASSPENASMGLHFDPKALGQLDLRRSDVLPVAPSIAPPPPKPVRGAPLDVPSRAARERAAAQIQSRPQRAEDTSQLRSWLRRPFFQLDNVVFFGLSRVDAVDMSQRLDLSSSVALIDVSPREVCARVLQMGRFSTCSALRIPPRTLAVAVRERTPIAVIAASGEGVARDGSRFELVATEGDGLPRIEGDVASALPYVDAARWAAVAISRLEVRDGARGARPQVVAWPAGTELRVLLGDDPIHGFLRYRALAHARVLDEAHLELDLRFRGSAFVRKPAAFEMGDEGEDV